MIKKDGKYKEKKGVDTIYYFCKKGYLQEGKIYGKDNLIIVHDVYYRKKLIKRELYNKGKKSVEIVPEFGIFYNKNGTIKSVVKKNY